MKKIILFSLLLCTLTACSISKPNQNYDYEQVDPPSPHGIPPVIYYHGKLYWNVDKISKLPVTYINSGDKIIASETDEDVVPKEECYTSNFNSNNVGANIYVDPANDNSIIINCDDYFLIFSQENK